MYSGIAWSVPVCGIGVFGRVEWWVALVELADKGYKLWRKVKNSIIINCDDCAAEKISQRIHYKFRFNEKNSEEDPNRRKDKKNI